MDAPDGSGAHEIPMSEPPHTDGGSDDPHGDEDDEAVHRTSEARARDVVKDRGVQEPVTGSDIMMVRRKLGDHS
jgi:hypothetical protein